MKLYGLLYPTLSLTLSPTIILVVVIPVITLDPIPTVPPVLTDVDLIVAIPSALNCSSPPEEPAIVTVGAVKYPNPLFPILIVLTVPAVETVTVAVACTGDGLPLKGYCRCYCVSKTNSCSSTNTPWICRAIKSNCSNNTCYWMNCCNTNSNLCWSIHDSDDVEIATVGAVVYALPVVLNATELGFTEEPAIPMVATATLVPG